MHAQIIEDTFDKLLYNSKTHHPMQSWEWGEARKQLGTKVVRVGQFTPDLSEVFQMTIHPVPYTSYGIGYIPRSTLPSDEVLDTLTQIANTNNLIFIKIEPYLEKAHAATISPRLRQSPHPLFPDWTIMLDLTKPEEELIKHMKPKTRYNIKLAQKKGVYVREESTDKGFEIFTDLYFKTCKRQKYHGHDLRYHETIWNWLKTGTAHILIAYYESEPLAAYELFHYHNVFYYPYGGTSDHHRNLMAANLIMWEAIRLGKKLGSRIFDMWGSLPPVYDYRHPWAGFTRFKEGYGGRFVEFAGSYDYVFRPILYPLYAAAHTVRSRLLPFIA